VIGEGGELNMNKMKKFAFKDKYWDALWWQQSISKQSSGNGKSGSLPKKGKKPKGKV